MKKIKYVLILFILFSLTTSNCTEKSDVYGCGYHNGHPLYKGPEGGCYYINSNGNKTYVDRSECDC